MTMHEVMHEMIVGECHEPNSKGSGSAWKAYMNAKVAGLFLFVLLEYPNSKGVVRATSRGLDMALHWSGVRVAPLISPRDSFPSIAKPSEKLVAITPTNKKKVTFAELVTSSGNMPKHKVGESKLIGPEIVYETIDKIVQIKERLKVARDRQKSYADNQRKPLELNVGNKVLLNVSPWKGVVCFGKRSKLSPRYVGPFEIVERVGLVAYRLRIPQELIGIHDTLNLKECLEYVILHVPLEEIKIDNGLRFVEEPIEIMECEVKNLKQSRIPIVKVRWNS
ncbi:hypothetical protein Tco_0111127 [Tanacetum coccineum]